MKTQKKKIQEFFKDINKQITKEEFEKKKVEFARINKQKQLLLTSEILEALNIKTPPSFLVTKPTKTLSGVTVVAVMTKPGECPGKCIYCPNSEIAPRSYTGFEPAAMRAKRNKFDPYKQIKDRLHQFEATGHPTNKIELIVMGGTFPAMPYSYQKNFMIKVYQAITDSKNKDLEQLKKIASKSKRRIVGLTFETRPDYCSKEIIKRLLEFGGTRVEIGVQILNDDILDYVNRGHRIDAVVNATKDLKEAGFKVLYHFMLALPKSTTKKDLDSFKLAFSDERFCPDMIKIYPCLVTKGTKIEKMLYNGEYKPYDLKTTTKLIADVKEFVPKWVRIMRIQRDIPATKIIAGIQKSNLRQLVQEELKKRNKKCQCIRCSEPMGVLKDVTNYEIKTIEYDAQKGKEYFIYAEKEGYLLGFIRLRIPETQYIKEITKTTTIVRELHVYGQTTNFEDHNIQHVGIGKELLKKAEEISKKQKYTKVAVISGVGVREYYKKQGYRLQGPYMVKNIGEKKNGRKQR